MARTYNEIYLDMRRVLKEAGMEEYALEARRLLAQAAGYSDAELIGRFYLYAPEETERSARALLGRRMAGEPLAYISGSWDFYGLKMIVNPSVMIPRMDTEVLVFTALELLRSETADPRILYLWRISVPKRCPWRARMWRSTVSATAACAWTRTLSPLLPCV